MVQVFILKQVESIAIEIKIYAYLTLNEKKKTQKVLIKQTF